MFRVVYCLKSLKLRFYGALLILNILFFYKRCPWTASSGSGKKGTPYLALKKCIISMFKNDYSVNARIFKVVVVVVVAVCI